MTPVYIDGVEVLAPGLHGWSEGKAVLAGDRPYREQQIPPGGANLLPANERRRATPTIKLALAVAGAVLARAALSPERICSVFASSSGDSDTLDRICKVLTLPERPVSPTHFHNSVHNAPAGYWSIATACRGPSVSLSAHDGTFSAGLLEAATIALVERMYVLLVAYEYPPPAPLSTARYFTAPFAVAMLVSAERTGHSLAGLALEPAASGVEDTVDDGGLERLRTGNPAARSLPLLQSLAGRRERRVSLPYLTDSRLDVWVTPYG